MKTLKIKDVMANNLFMIKSEDTVEQAAIFMRDINCGVLPVGKPGTPEGIITDRDIIVRVIAEGRNPTRTTVEEVMTRVLHTCDENESLEHAAQKMRQYSIRRLLVTKGGQVAGIVNFTNLIRNKGSKEIAENVLYALDKAKPSKKPTPAKMDTAGAGSEGYCDQFDDVL